MSATFRSKTTSTNAAAITFNQTVPAGVVNGDMLLWCVSCHLGSGNSLPVTPTGWNSALSLPFNTTDTSNQARIFWRIASSEPASYNIVNTAGTSGEWAGIMSAYSGSAIAVDTAFANSFGSGSSYATPSNFTATSSLQVNFICTQGSPPAVAFTDPAGFTSRATVTGTTLALDSAEKALSGNISDSNGTSFAPAPSTEGGAAYVTLVTDGRSSSFETFPDNQLSDEDEFLEGFSDGPPPASFVQPYPPQPSLEAEEPPEDENFGFAIAPPPVDIYDYLPPSLEMEEPPEDEDYGFDVPPLSRTDLTFSFPTSILYRVQSGFGHVGVVTTSSGGSVSPTGVVGTGAVGAVLCESGVPALGVVGTGAVGVVAIAIGNSPAVLGVQGIGRVGVVGFQVSYPVTGVVGTGVIGLPSIAVGQTPAPAGVQGIGQVGAVVISTTTSAAADSVVGYGRVGAVTVRTDSAVAVTGVQGAGQVGAVTYEVRYSVAGVSGAGLVGAPLASSGVPVLGVRGFGVIGVVAVTGGCTVVVQGVQGVGVVGTLFHAYGEAARTVDVYTRTAPPTSP